MTRVTGEEKFPQVVDFLARELAAGRQAYVVVPLIEEGGRADARAAEAEFERLAGQPALRTFKLGLLHGRLKAEVRRETVMEAFAARRDAAARHHHRDRGRAWTCPTPR